MVFLNNSKYASRRSSLFTEVEYQALNDIHDILESPNITQGLLSAEKTPTLAIALPPLKSSWTRGYKSRQQFPNWYTILVLALQKFKNTSRKGGGVGFTH